MKDSRVNIKPFTDGGVVVYSENWVSNGHFLVKKDLVKFGDKLTSDDAVAIAFPKSQKIVTKTDAEMLASVAPQKRLRLHTRSFWASDESAMFVDDDGRVTWLARDYADAFNLRIGYATDESSGIYNAAEIEAVTLVVMPIRNAPAWNEIAKCVAKATPLFEEKPQRKASRKAAETEQPTDVH